MSDVVRSVRGVSRSADQQICCVSNATDFDRAIWGLDFSFELFGLAHADLSPFDSCG
jgi:hypothetical protein